VCHYVVNWVWYVTSVSFCHICWYMSFCQFHHCIILVFSHQCIILSLVWLISLSILCHSCHCNYCAILVIFISMSFCHSNYSVISQPFGHYRVILFVVICMSYLSNSFAVSVIDMSFFCQHCCCQLHSLFFVLFFVLVFVLLFVLFCVLFFVLFLSFCPVFTSCLCHSFSRSSVTNMPHSTLSLSLF